ncbi:MAG: glycosyltransferase family 87 protein [Gemmatimonadales bacterium]
MLTLPRDAWPRLESDRATSRAIAVLYAVVLLYLVAELTRSVARADHVIFTDGYVAVGEAVLQGHDPYALRANTWPPFFLFLGTLLALAARVSPPGALLLWQLSSVLCIWGSLRLLARFFTPRGDEISFWPRSPARPAFASAPIIVPVLMSARLIQDNLQHTQINPHLLFLVLLAFLLFRQERHWRGGATLALAASIKAVPVVVVLYFLYKRKWAAAGWTVVFLILLNVVLPGAVFGPEGTVALWERWLQVSGTMSLAAGGHHFNQSLLAALRRVLSVWGGEANPIRYEIADLSPEAVNRVFVGSGVLVALGLAWMFRRHPRDLRHVTCAAEYAIVLGAVTLLSPLAWKGPYITLLPTYFFGWSRLRELPPGSARRWRFVLWWASFAGITLSAPGFLGKHLADRLESLSVVTVGAILSLSLGLSVLPAMRVGSRGVAHDQAPQQVPPGRRAPGR